MLSLSANYLFLMTKNKKVGLAQIANELGVSKTLVSLVINGKGNQHNINKDTQKKVWEKVKELNYRPNTIARSLRTGKSQNIGLIVADIANPFYAKLARIIEDFARKRGYNLVISSSDENPEIETQLIDIMLEHQMDGLIISTTQQLKDKFQELLDRNYPFVLVDREIAGVEANYVIVDNFEGAFSLTEQLINKGHEKIAYLSVTPDYLSSIKQREEGYLKALEKHNLDHSIIKKIDYKEIDGKVEEVINNLIINNKSIDAVFASNNNVAKTCLKKFKQHGIRIPEDISLVSFDDIDLFEFSNPPLTAVKQPLQEIGESAISLLLNQISGKNMSPKKIIHSTKIITRES